MTRRRRERGHGTPGLALMLLLASTALCPGCGPGTELEPLVQVTVFFDPDCAACKRARPWLERLEESWPGDVAITVRGSRLPRVPGDGLATPEEDRRVEAALGVPGTPTFFVGATLVDTRRGFAPLVPAVRRALGTSRVLLADGVQRSAIARQQAARGGADDRVLAWLFDGEAPPDRALRPARAGGAAGGAPRAHPAHGHRHGPHGAPEPPSVHGGARWAVTVDGSEPSEGPTDALVTLVVFEDLTSRFCAELDPVLRRVRAAWPHDVRVVHKLLPLPFHPQARAWARHALCAHETGTWPEARRAALRAPGAAPPARDLLSPLAECLASTRPDMQLATSARLARRVGAFGTPVVYLNGRKLARAGAPGAIGAAVEQELPLAEALAARVGRAGVYHASVATGRVREPLGEPVPGDGRPVAAALGSPDAPVRVQAWLDLAAADARRVLGALLTRLRRGDIALTVHAAPLQGDEVSERAARMAQCAMHAGTALRFLTVVAATAPVRHEHPLEPGQLDEAALGAGLDMDTQTACPPPSQVPLPPGRVSPVIVVDGRPYDGSLGYAPGALDQLFSR